jgi:hypothetical protein
MVELVNMSLPFVGFAEGSTKTNGFRGIRRGKYLPIVTSILVILMMGTLPIASANNSGPGRSSAGHANYAMPGRLQPVPPNYSGPAYTAVFYRTGCGFLGNDIQARYEWDISGGNNSNTMAIKEYGSNNKFTRYNHDGFFKFDEKAVNYSYTPSMMSTQYPGIEAFANFHNYTINSVDLITSVPENGYPGQPLPLNPENASSLFSYSANFSNAKDELSIQIIQSSTQVEALFRILSSSGVALKSTTLNVQFSGVTLPPPYKTAAVSDEIDGLDTLHNPGYANMFSGTDFQIESVINPSTATDFTGYAATSYSGTSNAFSLSPHCNLSSFVDEEGDGATYSSSSTTGTVSVNNEAYQYVKVT